MTGDHPIGSSESGGGLGGGAMLGVYQAIGNLGSGWTSGGLLNPAGGLGASALRGIAQASLAMQRAALGQQIIGQKLALAQIQLQAFPAAQQQGAVLIQTPQSNPAIKAAAESLMKLEALRQQAVTQRQQMNLARRAQAVQEHLARLEQKAAPLATYQYVAAYGLNNGPPFGT